MYKIVKKGFKFEAAHRLIQLPEGHKCRNLHGHSWKVDVEISVKNEDLDANTGFVIDFGELKFIKDYLDENFDHAVLIPDTDKELLDFCEKINTKYFLFEDLQYISAEYLASYIAYNVIYPKLEKILKCNFILIVSVWETENNKASFTI